MTTRLPLPGSASTSTWTIEAFNACLLLAIRAHGLERFNCWATFFHDAYGAVIEAVRDAAPASIVGLRWVTRDPLFANFHAAENMILCGLRDLVIELESPDLVMAQFRLSHAAAVQELSATVDPADIEFVRACGQIFCETYHARTTKPF